MRTLLGVVLAMAAAAAAPQAPEVYRLDAANTRVTLDVRVLGLPWLSAHFAELSGEMTPDHRAAPARVDVTLRTASLRCESARWNARLLSPDWFDAVRYPQIVFHSEHIRFDAAGAALVSGQLSLHGRTRVLELQVRHWTCPDPAGPIDGCSFSAHGRLRRSDYGLPYGLWEGGDEVDISIDSAGTGRP